MSGMTPGVKTMKPASGTLNCVMVTPEEVQDARRQDLTGDLRRGRHLPHVVDQPDGENGPGHQDHPQHFGRVPRTPGAGGGHGGHNSTATNRPRNMAGPPP